MGQGSGKDAERGSAPQSPRAGLPGGVSSERLFHDDAILVGVWLLVFFLGIKCMAEMREILVPLLWAFFLMMGLLPFTDFVEHLILRCFGLPVVAEDNGDQVMPERSAERSEDVSDSDDVEDGGSGLRVLVPPCCRTRSGSEACLRSVARGMAVLSTVVTTVVAISFFCVMIYRSALHMQENWGQYQTGAERISADLKNLTQSIRQEAQIPDDVIDSLTEKGLRGLEDLLTSMVSSIVEHVSSIMFSVMMMLLYMVFWLSHPVHIGKTVLSVFKNYILLKTLVSVFYAFFVFCLLTWLDVDLAIVFGLVTFVFNFVPEFGPLMAACLPLPVILFDARLDNPWLTMCSVFLGQIMLKCFFGNFVEVKLIESSREMTMHPVIILFNVAFFGWIWGPTGMLLSVPVVAAFKAMLHLMPARYRAPILKVLEGDSDAPRRFNSWIESHTKEHVGCTSFRTVDSDFDHLEPLAGSARSPRTAAPYASMKPAE